MSSGLHAADDADHWQQSPPGVDGAPIWVDLRFNLAKVNAVDTVAGTTFVNIATVCYWTDPRLAGWPVGAALPPAEARAGQRAGQPQMAG
jgi:hypothetical protein